MHYSRFCFKITFLKFHDNHTHPGSFSKVTSGQIYSLSTSKGFPLLNPNKGLVTNYGEGGATKREGGHVKFYHYEKGGAEKVLAMLKGGHKKFWGSFYVVG